MIPELAYKFQIIFPRETEVIEQKPNAVYINGQMYMGKTVNNDRNMGGGILVLNTTFNNISVILWRFYIGGGNRSTRKTPQTFRKSLINFIT